MTCLSNKLVTSRKCRPCTECGVDIHCGDPYVRRVDAVNHKIKMKYFHEECAEILGLAPAKEVEVA